MVSHAFQNNSHLVAHHLSDNTWIDFFLLLWWVVFSLSQLVWAGTLTETNFMPSPHFRRWFSIQNSQLVYQKKFKVQINFVNLHYIFFAKDLIIQPLRYKRWKECVLTCTSVRSSLYWGCSAVDRTLWQWWWRTWGYAPSNPVKTTRGGSALRWFHPLSKCVRFSPNGKKNFIQNTYFYYIIANVFNTSTWKIRQLSHVLNL